MAERRAGLRSGRDAAGLVGDAVMLSLADLVSRLKEAAPPEAARPDGAPAAVTPAVEPDAGAGVPAPPGLAAATDALGAVVAAIVPAVLSRIDLNEVVDRVDVQRVVDRVDVEQIVAQIDLDELVSRIDVDALVARVDVDALVRRIDLGAVTQEALDSVDIGAIVRDSTATIGTDIVDDGRLQAMRADALIARWVDRILLRRRPRRTALDGSPEGS
jgi:hypothetical protein